MMQKTSKVAAGIQVIRVDGWDSRCEVFVVEKTKRRLQRGENSFKLLNARSTECYLVKAPDDTPLLFVGIMPFTLIGGDAYIWIIPFKGLKARYLREMKKLFEVFATGFRKLIAQVYYCQTDEERFVKYFGFTPAKKVNGMTIYVKEK